MKEKVTRNYGVVEITYKLGKKERLNTYDAVRFYERPHEALVPFHYFKTKKGRYQVVFTAGKGWKLLSGFFESVDSPERLIGLLEAFCYFLDSVKDSDVYLKNIVFNEQRIFVDLRGSKPRLRFIYLPVEGVSGGLDNLYELLKSLSSKTALSTLDSAKLLLGEYDDFFRVPETFSAIKFKALVQKLHFDVLGGAGSDQESVLLSVTDSEPGAGLGDNLELARGEEFKVDVREWALQRGFCILTRLSTGEAWEIKSHAKAIALGTSPSSDIVCSGNAAVSRHHAQLTYVQGRWFLRDAESKNGTYVRSRRLIFGEQVFIESGSVFSLANEEFRLEY